jgi:hypothetical protein
MHCHMTHHVMNQMGHAGPTMIGADTTGLDGRIGRVVPGYMTMGKTGMGDMMKMEQPENSISMLGGDGPFGMIDMGGMFTVVKVRAKLEPGKDPGWFENPAGTVRSHRKPRARTSRATALPFEYSNAVGVCMKVQILSISLVWGLIGCGSSSTPPSIPTDPLTASGSGSGGHGSNHGSGGHHMTPVDAAPAPESPDAAPDPEVIKAAIKAGLMKTEMAAFDQAKPVFDRFCANCHVPDGKRRSRSSRPWSTSTWPAIPTADTTPTTSRAAYARSLASLARRLRCPKASRASSRATTWLRSSRGRMRSMRPWPEARMKTTHTVATAPRAPASPETAHPTDGHAH